MWMESRRRSASSLTGALRCFDEKKYSPPEVSNFLMQALDLEPSDVYPMKELLDYTGLFQIHGLPGFPQLRDPQFVPQPVPEFATSSNVFALPVCRYGAVR